MTTQNKDIKASLRIGTMFNEAGERFFFELAAMNRTTHYDVTLEIFKGEHKVANLISTETKVATSIQSVRGYWQGFHAHVMANYSVVSHETDTKVLGQEYKNTKWEAAPAGDIRQAALTCHDGNEGHYVVVVDYVELSLSYGGTSCPDIPAEITKEMHTDRATLEAAYAARMTTTRKRWTAERMVVTYGNFVTRVMRLEAVAA